MLGKRAYWNSADCPRCSSHVENLEHMLRCPHAVSREKFTTGLTNIHTWMLRSYTEVTLADGIIRATNLWIDDPQMETFWPPCPPTMLQIQIGWLRFLLGRLHISFTNHQHDYFVRKGFSRSALSWTKRLIINLWSDVVRPQWQHRTSIVHALEKTTTQTRLHKELIDEVCILYYSTRQQDLLSDDRHLLDTPLDELITWRYNSLLSWKNYFQVAVA